MHLACLQSMSRFCFHCSPAGTVGVIQMRMCREAATIVSQNAGGAAADVVFNSSHFVTIWNWKMVMATILRRWWWRRLVLVRGIASAHVVGQQARGLEMDLAGRALIRSFPALN